MGEEMTKSQEAGPSLPEAMRFLAHEKSAAEQYAVILSTLGKNDAVLYVRGIALYADAKAEFDGLIGTRAWESEGIGWCSLIPGLPLRASRNDPRAAFSAARSS
jgi:hypothetical protein